MGRPLTPAVCCTFRGSHRRPERVPPGVYAHAAHARPGWGPRLQLWPLCAAPGARHSISEFSCAGDVLSPGLGNPAGVSWPAPDHPCAGLRRQHANLAQAVRLDPGRHLWRPHDQCALLSMLSRLARTLGHSLTHGAPAAAGAASAIRYISAPELARQTALWLQTPAAEICPAAVVDANNYSVFASAPLCCPSLLPLLRAMRGPLSAHLTALRPQTSPADLLSGSPKGCPAGTCSVYMGAAGRPAARL